LDKKIVETDPGTDPFLTVAEVAAMLKLNQQTVRNWIDQGSLPAFKVGRRVRIRRSDFERVLERGYSGGSTSVGGEAGPSADDFWGGTPVGLAEEPGAGVDAGPRVAAGAGGGGGDGAGSPAVDESGTDAAREPETTPG
jgi:excisionase family DNA binding protein